MKNIKIYPVILIALAVTCAGLWFNKTYASERITGNNVVVKDRVVEEDLLVAGSNVRIQAEIKGDLAVAGSEVNITAPVGGYVLAAGSNVSINSSVGNDLWAAGSNVTINNSVGDNAMLAGNTVNLSPEASIRSDASIAGNTITVKGRVEHNLKLAASEAQIGSEIGGNVEADVERLIILPGAVIRGNLIVHGSHPPEISPEAQVLGQTEFRPREQRSPWLSWLFWWIYGFLALLITGFAVLLLSKVWANRVAQTFIGKPLYSLLAGLLALILVPVVIVLLAITVVGIPLALIFLAFYCTVLILSCVFAAYLVGDRLLSLMNRPQASPWLRMTVGALVLSFAASLPWLGWLVQLLILLIGFGALFLERWNIRQHLRSEAAV